MSVTRRDFLGLGGATAAGAALPGWAIEAAPRPAVRWAARTVADMPEPDLPAMLLSRAAFGGRPGDVERARQMGAEAWIEEQVDPAAISDQHIDDELLAGGLDTIFMTGGDLLRHDKGGLVINQLHAATLYRMIFSPRLLFEVLVDFWSDHFTITHPQAQCNRLKTVDDRKVARLYALATFKELLTASAQSPAMLHYLNNDVNTKNRPNENYAREIMELHTLGVAVDGVPYSETDVKEVARCLTGWTWQRSRAQPNYGEFIYNNGQHDQGSKTVLGAVIPTGLGWKDGFEVIDLLCAHDATPRFLATKLVRRFVTDDPVGEVPELVDAVADAYRRSDGGIGAMLSAILTSREFAGSFAAYGGKLTRPLDLVPRAARAVDMRPTDLQSFSRIALGRRGFLAMMGQQPFYWPTPDGYPDVKEAWFASSVALARWNYALALVGSRPPRSRFNSTIKVIEQTPDTLTKAGEVVDFWIDRILHRAMLDVDRALLVDFLTAGGTEFDTLTRTQRERIRELVALILDSPYFQWR